jgi:hypothetical protein
MSRAHRRHGRIKVALQQLLVARERAGAYYGLIIDPETDAIVAEIPLWSMAARDVFELQIEWRCDE